jgi:hypothetical protein
VSHITYPLVDTVPRQKLAATVDDGTGTIECAIRTREGEDKPESKTSEDRDRPRDVRASSTRERTNGLASTSARPAPDPLLIPVGSVVNVQGKIRVKHNSRELQGDTIGLYFHFDSLGCTREERILLLNDGVARCRGLGEELKHWQRVTTLHKNYYFLPERFVIPSSATNAVDAQDTPHTPKSTKVIASVASTPSVYSTASSSAPSSPAKSPDNTSVRSKKPQLAAAPASEISDFFYFYFYCTNKCPASTATSSSIPSPQP